MSQAGYAESFPERHADESTQLTRDDLDTVHDLLGEIAPGWSADLNHAGLYESTIVLTPEGANDLIGPAFVLHRSYGRVQLDQFRWDEYRQLGGYNSLDDALTVLRARLSPLVARSAPDPDRTDC